MKLVYVVNHHTGVGEDSTYSHVFVCGTEKQAKSFCAKANRWLEKNNLNFGNPLARDAYFGKEGVLRDSFEPSFDRMFHFDYTGADYSFCTVEWRDE
jgi:hypothetical protein